MKKLTGILTFIVCIPLIGTIFIKPARHLWKHEEDDTSVINERFAVAVTEDIGTFYYKPESLTGLLMYRIIPEDTVFSSSEDFIVAEDAVRDPEQEYLKALSIVCRSNIVYAWEDEQCPDILDYGKMQFDAYDFYKIIQMNTAYTNVFEDDNGAVKLNEIKRAVEVTKGAVITRDGKVIAAPFFTTSPSDLLVLETGSGVGFSLNYAYELAVQGMDFYELLKYFYDDIRVMIY